MVKRVVDRKEKINQIIRPIVHKTCIHYAGRCVCVQLITNYVRINGRQICPDKSKQPSPFPHTHTHTETTKSKEQNITCGEINLTSSDNLAKRRNVGPKVVVIGQQLGKRKSAEFRTLAVIECWRTNYSRTVVLLLFFLPSFGRSSKQHTGCIRKESPALSFRLKSNTNTCTHHYMYNEWMESDRNNSKRRRVWLLLIKKNFLITNSSVPTESVDGGDGVAGW